MSLRHEELSPEDLARQRDLKRSWDNARQALADPAFRARLEESIARVNGSASTTALSKSDFLADTESTVS